MTKTPKEEVDAISSSSTHKIVLHQLPCFEAYNLYREVGGIFH